MTPDSGCRQDRQRHSLRRQGVQVAFPSGDRWLRPQGRHSTEVNRLVKEVEDFSQQYYGWEVRLNQEMHTKTL